MRVWWLLLGAFALLPLHAAPPPRQAAIASAHAEATAAGQAILAAGGNAFDAAVAVAAALAVVEPESSGLGGGGFAVLHRASDGHQVFLDARERAPGAATRDMFLDARGQPDRRASVTGARAAAIPGTPALLAHLAERYGRLPLARSLAPAIELAERGVRWSEKNRQMALWRRDALAADREAARIFLRRGQVPEVGMRLKQPDLGRTLRALARDGAAGFYRGAVAERLVAGVRAGGGIWTNQDLLDYQVIEREPLRFSYGGYRFVTAPPPSSGGVALAQMFHMLSGYDRGRLDRVAQVHLYAEIFRRAYRDRAIYLGDPDHVRVPVPLLTSPEYAAGLRASIHLERALPSDYLPGIRAGDDGPDTTHFSIIDGEGNLIALTQSINLPFGAAFVPPGTGVLLNDHMDDFSVKPGTPNAFGLIGEDANAIAPGKRPLSSMTPTLMLGADRIAVLGTPGGSRIITMVFQAALAVIDGADAASVVAAPRIHHQYLPDVIAAEPEALSQSAIEALRRRGFTVSPSERPWGNMQVVIWDLASGRLDAASDPRWTVGQADVRNLEYR